MRHAAESELTKTKTSDDTEKKRDNAPLVSPRKNSNFLSNLASRSEGRTAKILGGLTEPEPVVSAKKQELLKEDPQEKEEKWMGPEPSLFVQQVWKNETGSISADEENFSELQPNMSPDEEEVEEVYDPRQGRVDFSKSDEAPDEPEAPLLGPSDFVKRVWEEEAREAEWPEERIKRTVIHVGDDGIPEIVEPKKTTSKTKKPLKAAAKKKKVVAPPAKPAPKPKPKTALKPKPLPKKKKK